MNGIKLEQVSALPQVTNPLGTDFLIGVQSLGNGNYRAVLNPVSSVSGGGGTIIYSTLLTGSVNNYVATIAGFTAYAQWQIFFFECNVTNTGISTINVSSKGNVNVHKFGSLGLDSGDMIAGQVYGMMYDGANFQIFSVTNNIEVAP